MTSESKPTIEEIADAYRVLRNFQDCPNAEIKKRLEDTFPGKTEEQIRQIVIGVFAWMKGKQ